MSTDQKSHPAAGFLVRRHIELLATLAILFILQTGLVPFDFAREQAEEGSTVFFSAATNHLTFPDIVSNIFLYVPAGLLLHCWFCRLLGNRLAAALLAIGSAAVLSGGIEWIQAYSAARVSSIIDLTSNVVGTSIGVFVSLTARTIVPRFLGAALFEFHEQPGTVFVKVYCLALIVMAALPFSFSFDSTRLKQCFKKARIVPFAVVTEDAVAADEALASNDHRSWSLARWRSMKHGSRWAAECASFALLAWLLWPMLRKRYQFSERTTWVLVCWIGGLLAVGLSLLQLPILTRGFDATDILFRLFGIGGGLVTLAMYNRAKEHWTPRYQVEQLHRLARAGCVAMLAYVAYAGVIPLTFNIEQSGPVASIRSEGFLPFVAYFATRFDLMMDDAMEKFISFALFAALLAITWPRAASMPIRSRVLAISMIGVAVSIPIEIVQMFIPVRVTSLTDPILAFCGCAVGVLAEDHAVAFFRFATTHEMFGPKGVRTGRETPSELAPADALIASLSEPRPDAPTEPSPKRRPTRQR